MEKSYSLRELSVHKAEDDIFIYTAGRNYSYKDTLALTEVYKDYLRKNYFKPSYSALLGNNSADMIFIILAMWSQGITPVLVNTRLTKSETKRLLQQSGCRQAVINRNLSFSDDEFKILQYPLADSPSNQSDDTLIHPDDTAVIIFTSGSTGFPRGVELTFGMLKETAGIQNKYLGQTRGDKWLASLPFYHIGGFSIITRSLFGGASVIIPSTLKNEDLAASIEKFRPDFISLVGTQLKKFLDTGYSPGYQVKNILVGGGFTDEAVIREALSKGWPISKVYGSTETGAFIAAAGPDELKFYPASAGRELVRESIDILDNDYNPLPRGSEGEIALKDIPLMKGYHNDKESTGKRYYEGYYLTGDIGYKNEDGFIFVLMRRSDLIVSGGENIDPYEVERAVRKINGIDDVYVFGIPDEEWGQSAAAVIKSHIVYTAEDIKRQLQNGLSSYKIPKQFFFTREIPRNELGKIDITALKKLIGIH